jgi:hypothetical protein
MDMIYIHQALSVKQILQQEYGKPKTAPSVTYGTNGFFLKFENSQVLLEQTVHLMEITLLLMVQ